MTVKAFCFLDCTIQPRRSAMRYSVPSVFLCRTCGTDRRTSSDERLMVDGAGHWSGCSGLCSTPSQSSFQQWSRYTTAKWAIHDRGFRFIVITAVRSYYFFVLFSLCFETSTKYQNYETNWGIDIVQKELRYSLIQICKNQINIFVVF